MIVYYRQCLWIGLRPGSRCSGPNRSRSRSRFPSPWAAPNEDPTMSGRCRRRCCGRPPRPSGGRSRSMIPLQDFFLRSKTKPNKLLEGARGNDTFLLEDGFYQRHEWQVINVDADDRYEKTKCKKQNTYDFDVNLKINIYANN
jgi:hypothetical protein